MGVVSGGRTEKKREKKLVDVDNHVVIAKGREVEGGGGR